MEKQTVSAAVSDSDLEQVEFNVQPLALTLTGEDGLRETLALRVFLPKPVQGRWHLIEEIICRLRAMLGRTTGEEHDFYQWVIQMLRFYVIYPTLDPHRSRRFNLDTFDHSETLQALAAQTQAKRLAKPERLIKFAGETTTPTNRLLLDAIYIRPDLSIPLGRPDYITFQEEYLSEMMRVMEQIDGIKRNAIETLQHHIEKVQRDVESDKGLSADQCAKVVAELTSIQAEALANLDQLYLKCMRSEIEEALEAEDKLAAQFADLPRLQRSQLKSYTALEAPCRLAFPNGTCMMMYVVRPQPAEAGAHVITGHAEMRLHERGRLLV
jgi:hypothetical protein